MNVQTNLRMDKPAFLAWVQERDERYELDEGHVVMMTVGTRGHALMIRRLAAALERRLDGTIWSTLRYPDLVVDVAGGALQDLTATAPVLIAEVISPSSATDDLGDKAAQYLRLASLAAYLVLAQDEPKAWIWVRGDSGFPAGPEVIGEDGAIRIPSLQIELPLAEIYGTAPSGTGSA